jgi:very-short-patch-repair endonuclease
MERKKEKQIIKNYLKSRSAVKTGKVFGISSDTIYRLLERNGISRFKKKMDFEKDKVISSYKKLNSLKRVGKEFGCSPIPILRILKECGIQRPNSGRFKKGRIQKNKKLLDEEIIKKLYSETKNCETIARLFNCSTTPILRILKENNVEILKPGVYNKKVLYAKKDKDGKSINHGFYKRKHKKETIEKKRLKINKELLKKKYYYEQKSIREIAKELNTSESTIKNRFLEYGIKTYRSERVKKNYSRKKYSKEINKIKQARAKQILPVKDTTIEVKIQNFLKRLEIDFFTHQYMKIKHGYQCDILIPSMNLVIECDGDYWHKYPIGTEVDHIRTKELIKNGFKVLRLWEHEIKIMTINKFNKKLKTIK